MENNILEVMRKETRQAFAREVIEVIENFHVNSYGNDTREEAENINRVYKEFARPFLLVSIKRLAGIEEKVGENLDTK